MERSGSGIPRTPVRWGYPLRGLATLGRVLPYPFPNGDAPTVLIGGAAHPKIVLWSAGALVNQGDYVLSVPHNGRFYKAGNAGALSASAIDFAAMPRYIGAEHVNGQVILSDCGPCHEYLDVAAADSLPIGAGRDPMPITRAAPLPAQDVAAGYTWLNYSNFVSGSNLWGLDLSQYRTDEHVLLLVFRDTTANKTWLFNVWMTADAQIATYDPQHPSISLLAEVGITLRYQARDITRVFMPDASSTPSTLTTTYYPAMGVGINNAYNSSGLDDYDDYFHGNGFYAEYTQYGTPSLSQSANLLRGSWGNMIRRIDGHADPAANDNLKRVVVMDSHPAGDRYLCGMYVGCVLICVFEVVFSSPASLSLVRVLGTDEIMDIPYGTDFPSTSTQIGYHQTYTDEVPNPPQPIIGVRQAVGSASRTLTAAKSAWYAGDGTLRTATITLASTVTLSAVQDDSVADLSEPDLGHLQISADYTSSHVLTLTVGTQSLSFTFAGSGGRLAGFRDYGGSSYSASELISLTDNQTAEVLITAPVYEVIKGYKSDGWFFAGRSPDIDGNWQFPLTVYPAVGATGVTARIPLMGPDAGAGDDSSAAFYDGYFGSLNAWGIWFYQVDTTPIVQGTGAWFKVLLAIQQVSAKVFQVYLVKSTADLVDGVLGPVTLSQRLLYVITDAGVTAVNEDWHTQSQALGVSGLATFDDGPLDKHRYGATELVTGHKILGADNPMAFV